jgi:hypothetical protein
MAKMPRNGLRSLNWRMASFLNSFEGTGNKYTRITKTRGGKWPDRLPAGALIVAGLRSIVRTEVSGGVRLTPFPTANDSYSDFAVGELAPSLQQTTTM